MRRLSPWLFALFLAVAAVATPAVSEAGNKTKVEWKKVEAPAGDLHDLLIKRLKPLLKSAASKADFGSGKKVILHARIVEFTSVTRGDVHRVSCTLVGRVQGGAPARSRISFGGRPQERVALEKQVLTMVANGVVTRLAEIVRVEAEAEKKKKAAEAEADEES
ncbi:hypothetical protein [Chondromyces crocatus]|uniref:Secreted protein n=1 Tax=Chondromyces crocatus TaxID=52 RepID=A0A0K1E5S0_CHOCO|nr:hypothetical protein [Chondromyces crocatus]AKT36221.1 uncharacterized protein CMC5_003350 [Chondromyces crocatus]